MREPLRVVWLTRHLWPQAVGGVELRVEMLSRQMARQGCRVELWTPSLPAGRRERADDGRELLGMGGPRAPGPLWPLGPLWRLAHAAWRLPARRAADVVFCPDPILSCAGLLGGPRAPLVFCPGGTNAGSYRWNFAGAGGDGPAARCRAALGPGRQILLAERAALARAAGVIAVSHSVRRQMSAVRAGRSRQVRVVYSGGDRYAGKAPEAPVDPSTAGALTALTVARLHPIKNVEHLLRAWALVRRRPRRLWIAGDGEQMPLLRLLAARLGLDDSVAFLGERRDVRELLSSADVFVLPSLYEACPLALLEAMTAGLPAITLASVPGVSEVAASGEINVDGVTGFVVDPRDPSALAERLDLLAERPELRRRMGLAAARRAAERFTWARAAAAYLDFARDLCSLRQGAPQAPIPNWSPA